MDTDGTERLRAQLKNTNHLSVLAKDTAAISFSDVWEKGGKQASVDTEHGDPTLMSLSQAKNAMVAACKKGIDASIYGRMGSVDVNRMGALIGKADTKMAADIYIYNCKSKKINSSAVIIAFNAMGQDPGQTDRSIGAGLAAKLLEISN